MKKKNRTILFWMLLILSLISLIWFVTLSINGEPHFKITKEVCHNETYTIGYFEYPEWNGNISKFLEIDDININFNLSSSCPSCAISIINKEKMEVEYIVLKELKKIRKEGDEIIGDIEKCKQVEVDEIEFDKESMWALEWEDMHKYFKCIWSCEDFNHHYPLINGELCDIDRKCNYLKPKLSKQDLTIDWLDENCECDLEYHKLIWCPKISETECLDILSEKGCQKYKYNEYRVEVWKQIK